MAAVGSTGPNLGTQTTIRRRWVLVAAAVGVCLLVSIGIFAFAKRHGDPDPDGRIADALKSIDAAIPDGASNLQTSVGVPQWSACDGRADTYGWTEVSRFITFATATDPEELGSSANTKLTASGWSGLSRLQSAFGPGFTWTRTLPDGTPLRASLSPGSQDNGRTIVWSLMGVGRSHGPAASGC
jgi:hypothetical protein